MAQTKIPIIYTLAWMKDAVYMFFGGQTEASTIYPTELVDELNRAQLRVLLSIGSDYKGGLLKKKYTVTGDNTTTAFPFPTVTISSTVYPDVAIPLGVNMPSDIDNEKKFTYCNEREFIETGYKNPDDLKARNTFLVYLSSDANDDNPSATLNIYPALSSGDVVDFHYVKYPMTMTADTDRPSLPIEYHQAIIDNAVMYLMQKDPSFTPQERQESRMKFIEEMQRARRAMSRQFQYRFGRMYNSADPNFRTRLR